MQATQRPPAPQGGRTQRRNALIATSIAVPVTVILAFALTNGRSTHHDQSRSSAALPGISVAAPPSPNASTQRNCITVVGALPVQLGSLNPRKTETDSAFVVAWGDPAIVLRCGVPSSPVFGDPRAAQPIDINGVLWQPDPQKNQTVYTTLDRAVNIDVTVPAGADQPLPLLEPAISKLPKLCTGTDAAGNTGVNLPSCK